MTMQSLRCARFNPTSIPSLRKPIAQSHFYHSSNSLFGYSVRARNQATHLRLKNGMRRQSTEVTETGENKTGHISAKANEGILFFDHVSPMRLNWSLRLPWHLEKRIVGLFWKLESLLLSSYEPANLVKRIVPSSLPISVTEVLPRLKDGGAFMKFSYSEGMTATEIETLITNHLKENPIAPWFNPFKRVHTNLVVGKPWIEDLHRFPSRRIKVEFIPTSPGGEAAELSQEALYGLFRKYGKIAEISSQPSDSKILPKFAYMDFDGIRHSIMARNCMHGFKVLEKDGGGKAGTELRLSFETTTKAHLIRDYIVNHPRLFIPLAVALLGTITVAVFDPIRTFFIKAHIDHAFSLKDFKLYKWIKGQATDIFTFRIHKSEEAGLHAIWDDRKESIDQLQTWLMETADTFIVIQGPRGSGKKELVFDQTLKGRKNVLLIDCKPIQEARGDAATINAAAASVGYRPVFSWMNSISSLIDLAAQGTIGTKTGFSETLDTQLAQIWQNTANALKQLALQERKKDDKDSALADDDWLEAHPECRPVIVIDNFLHKNEESSMVYEKIAGWAAGCTTSNIAHVIFLTNDISYSKSLSKALPDRVFRQLALGDITPEVARKFVVTHLETDQMKDSGGPESSVSKGARNLEDLDECIETLGGRLTDLEFLARRLKTGQSPKYAIAEIIDQGASEIMKMYLLTADKTEQKWSTEQAWYLIKSLAERDELRYNEVLLSDTFASSLSHPTSSGENVLDALAAVELISIKTYNGRPQSIKPGKPVYQAAFKVLTEDKVLKSRLDLAILKELSSIEAKSIDKYEKELMMLGSFPKQSSETAPRVQYLLTKLAASQKKVEIWEKEMGGLKNILMKEY